MSDYHHILVNHPDAVVRVDIHGGIGAPGKDAYQSYVETTSDDPILTEEEWSSASATPEWDAIANKPSTFPPTIGPGAGDAVAGNDPRLDGPLELTAPPENESDANRINPQNVLTSVGATSTCPVLFESGLSGGRPLYKSEDYIFGTDPDYIDTGWICLWSGSFWVVYYYNGVDVAPKYHAQSTGDVATPDLASWSAPSTGTGTPDFNLIPASGTVASQLGQLAIATIDGARIYSFRNINLSPMTWEGATPGLLYNATLGEWRIATLTGADGSESITYGPL